MVFLVVQAVDEAVRDGHGANQPVPLQNAPILGFDVFDAAQSDGGGVLGQRFDRHRLEAPGEHRLLDAPLGDHAPAAAPLQTRLGAQGRGPAGGTAAVVPAWSISRRVRRFDRLLMARASLVIVSTEMFNSANVSRIHFSERSIIGPPWPSHSMLNTPS